MSIERNSNQILWQETPKTETNNIGRYDVIMIFSSKFEGIEPLKRYLYYRVFQSNVCYSN